MDKGIISRSQKLIFLFLTAAVGLFLLYPYRNYQPLLAQGDHGIGLYVPWAILQGDHLYRDVHWWYGPLMPYYYAFCLKIFGINIQSVLLGKIFLTFLCSLFFYFILITVAYFIWRTIVFLKRVP